MDRDPGNLSSCDSSNERYSNVSCERFAMGCNDDGSKAASERKEDTS